MASQPEKKVRPRLARTPCPCSAAEPRWRPTESTMSNSRATSQPVTIERTPRGFSFRRSTFALPRRASSGEGSSATSCGFHLLKMMPQCSHSTVEDCSWPHWGHFISTQCNAGNLPAVLGHDHHSGRCGLERTLVEIAPQRLDLQPGEAKAIDLFERPRTQQCGRFRVVV